MRQYRIGRLKGKFVVSWWEDGRRKRYRLDADTLGDAEREARDVILRETAPSGGVTVSALWSEYMNDRNGRAIEQTMRSTGKALLTHLGALRPEQITTEDCRSYHKTRAASGRSAGTIWTELGHLRIVLNWARKQGLIERTPHIELPPKPAPKDRYLTRAEIGKLLAAEAEPHINLAIQLMLMTGGRVGAILELTWDRVDLERGQINLRLDASGPRKGRAIVPVNSTLRAALVTARQAALSDHVIEWAGGPVGSIRKGFARAVENAGLSGVTPHTLRHTAAVHMAEAGIPMSRISQFLGHSNTSVTERVYARYAPDHLRDAAEALNFGGVRVVK